MIPSGSKIDSVVGFKYSVINVIWIDLTNKSPIGKLHGNLIKQILSY